MMESFCLDYNDGIWTWKWSSRKKQIQLENQIKKMDLEPTPNDQETQSEEPNKETQGNLLDNLNKTPAWTSTFTSKDYATSRDVTIQLTTNFYDEEPIDWSSLMPMNGYSMDVLLFPF